MLYNAAKLLLFCELSKYFNTFCYLCRKFLVMKISKNRYLQGFLVVVLLLALVRVIFPSVAESRLTARSDGKDSTAIDSLRGDSDASGMMASAGAQDVVSGDASSSEAADLKKDELSVTPDTASDGRFSIFFDKNGKEVKHRIFSVPHFGNTFPDQQDVQIVAAGKHGVAPVQNREEAEHS